MNLKLQRIYRKDCTLGILDLVNEFSPMLPEPEFTCFTLELPDLNNQQNISCIPEGKYNCKLIVSPSLGRCIDVQDVYGRTYIRIHKGNFTSQILGCILVGDSIKDLNGDNIPDVASSKETLNALMSLLPVKFTLEIFA